MKFMGMGKTHDGNFFFKYIIFVNKINVVHHKVIFISHGVHGLQHISLLRILRHFKTMVAVFVPVSFPAYFVHVLFKKKLIHVFISEHFRFPLLLDDTDFNHAGKMFPPVASVLWCVFIFSFRVSES